MTWKVLLLGGQQTKSSKKSAGPCQCSLRVGKSFFDLSLSFEDSLHADLKEGKIGIVFWLKMKIIATDSFVYIEHIELNFWLLPTHSVP